ncbi:penicillin acylase family protein [Acidovorax sp. NCPPB 4044]|uniref:penicillin acylase family protein n=1 Tax=Acidovorax sp. NCPPB 4044 TaxID=2940490 RepID=UPI00230203A7|nr:penicillin acylase family protein [Acidovorax sp. NCPPB 4044]MDA8519638.1 penicillin acylase family protein [Acidovorax sp. NCPPB 4044]
MHESSCCGLRPLSALCLAALTACGGSTGNATGDAASGRPAATYQAEIRRTAMGIPHIKANSWGSAGFGYGYAQAQDNLCTMADSFLTYRGERSRHFGGDARVAYDSTLGRPLNIESDFFHRHVLTADVIERMAASQPEKLRQMVEGFAAGYNRYLQEARTSETAHAACRTESWVQPIAAQDLWRRMFAANLAGGYSNFAAAIANATLPQQTPLQPAATHAPARTASIDPRLTRAPALQVGGTLGVGSNMMGFGSAATGEGTALLFGNPHWYWKGADRFYQAQLTIPGELDVSGVSFLGIPVVLIGFNADIAWSHTVSTARRFGLYQLQLAEDDRTSYLRDGRRVAMQPHTITVQNRDPSGAVVDVTRTLYQTDVGPVVNLGHLNPALAWSDTTAFAIRDINAGNFRSFRMWMRWSQAKSLDEFIGIQRQEAATPWVNTVAVGRGQPDAWYADIGAVPNVSAEQMASCATAAGKAVAAALPNVPFLDGSRSDCDWQSDPDSVQAGAVGLQRMPSQLRPDYVANMNDSYWLTNVHAPLTGFPAIFGPAGTQAQTLRTRLGHAMVLDRFAGADGYAGRLASSAAVRQMVLGSRVFSAERFKDDALGIVCAAPQIALNGSDVEVASACAALRAWDNTGSATARGSHVWDEFWRRAQALPATQLYAEAFDPARPIDTPRGLRPAAAGPLRQAFAEAVAKVRASGFAMDAPRGEVLYATRGGQKIPLYGGCGWGYFTITCSENPIDRGGYSMDGQPHGNSYLQVVGFPAGRVLAHTLLAHSLSDDPASPHQGDSTRAYGRQQWLRVPFTEDEITADADYRTITVRP